MLRYLILFLMASLAAGCVTVTRTAQTARPSSIQPGPTLSLATANATGTPTASPRRRSAPTPEAVDGAFVVESCASVDYDNCEESLRLAMGLWQQELVAICEYGDGQGDVVLLERRGDAEDTCSGEGLITPSRAAMVVRLP
ncbi:hypothetical protein BH23CHL8_BH23CHL8_24130 [soil metagenome]